MVHPQGILASQMTRKNVLLRYCNSHASIEAAYHASAQVHKILPKRPQETNLLISVNYLTMSRPQVFRTGSWEANHELLRGSKRLAFAEMWIQLKPPLSIRGRHPSPILPGKA
jgi:hypothetical protein